MYKHTNLNVSRVGRSGLVRIITEPELRCGLVSVANGVMRIVELMILRQKAINVLRSRMKRKFSTTIIAQLEKADPQFAKTFCHEHLGMVRTTDQLDLPLILI